MNAPMRRYAVSRHKPDLDEFAEYLSQEMSPAEAAEAMGRPRKAGKDLFKRLRRIVGWQAQ